jgi:5-hydroxyisourate hydrolase-like protein (transthyretin family)
VNITVNVTDGVSGHPAEGVKVTVADRPAGELGRGLHGLTDPQGNFTYSPGAEGLPHGGCYSLELDVDAYFASLGILAGYKQVTIVVRVVSTQTEYRIGTLITPFAHASWSIR